MKDEALDLVLEALEQGIDGQTSIQMDKAITAIKQARSAPVQEPVEILRKDFHRRMKADGHTQTALAILDSGIYLSPSVQNEWEKEKKKYIAAQRQWVGLTDWEISQLWLSTSPYFNEEDFARAIEAKLKEKNT